MAELLSADEVARELSTLDGWQGDAREITRTAELPTFPAAITVVDRVAEIAEEMNHHPDIDIRWRKVTLRCATHSAGGVTGLDVRLAHHIDEIVRDITAG